MDDHKRFAFLFAVDEDNGFGLNGGLPWPKNKADMQRFRDLTMTQIVCVGRETAKTLPKLPGRLLISLTTKPTVEERVRNLKWHEDKTIPLVYTADDVIVAANAMGDPETRVFFAGGRRVLWGLHMHPKILWAHVSVIHEIHTADTRLELHAWLRHGAWQQVSKTEAEGVTFYDYARGAALQ